MKEAKLTRRAESYLATFVRRPAPSVQAVSESLARVGAPAFPAWLDFHAQFAGYEEVILNEIAIWGLIHTAPTWLDANEVTVEHDGMNWRIVCADVHPSYDYWLDSEGRFVGLGGGGPFASFAVKIERDALFHEASVGRAWKLDIELSERVKDIEAAQQFIPELSLVPEASDEYSTCWKATDAIVVCRSDRLTFTVARQASERLRKAAIRSKG